MAILKNRVKQYKKAKFRIGHSLYFSLTHIAPITTIILLIGIAINTSFLSIDKALVDFSGHLYSRFINPAEKFLKDSVAIIVNIINFDRLHSDNIMLKIENRQLQNHAISTKSVEIENTQLKEHLKLVAPTDIFVNKRAKIIFHTTSDSDGFLLITGGAENGFQSGDVILSHGHLLGRIVTVGKNYSKISLINAYSSRIPVITTNTGLKAIFVGNAERGGYLLHLHGRQKPTIGELIVTSGDGTYYPKGIPVARVVSVNGDNVVATILSDPASTDFVEILSQDKFLN